MNKYDRLEEITKLVNQKERLGRMKSLRNLTYLI